MNVMYVLKRYPRLSETFIVREVVELEARGVRVLIDALLPAEQGPRHPLVDAVAAPVRYLPRRPRLWWRDVATAHLWCAARRPVTWVREARRARRFGTWRRFLQAGMVARRARHERASVLHAHFATAASEVAGHASALSGIPYTVTAHAKDIFTDENARLLARRVADAATVVTVSEHNRAHLRDVLPTTPVRVVRNAVPVAHAHGPTLDGPILTVARLVEKKGLDLLLQAMVLVHRTHPAVQLHIVGDGPLRDELELLATRLGVAESVTFHGAQPSTFVQDAYRRASLVVLPCRVAGDGDRDGLPTVLVEAMSHALPVVSTDVVGIGELITDQQTGLLVTPESPAALAQAIERLVDDPALAEALGQAGRARVADAYDPARSATQLASVFGQVAR